MLPARRSPTRQSRVETTEAGATRGRRNEARQKPQAYSMPTLSIAPRMDFAVSRSGHGKFAADALLAFALVILPLFALIVAMALLGSAEPGTALPNTVDGAGMLILPP